MNWSVANIKITIAHSSVAFLVKIAKWSIYLFISFSNRMQIIYSRLVVVNLKRTIILFQINCWNNDANKLTIFWVNQWINFFQVIPSNTLSWLRVDKSLLLRVSGKALILYPLIWTSILKQTQLQNVHHTWVWGFQIKDYEIDICFFSAKE